MESLKCEGFNEKFLEHTGSNHLGSQKCRGARAPPVKSRRYGSCMGWTTGVWLPRSPTTIPPLCHTNAPKAATTSATLHSRPTTRHLCCNQQNLKRSVSKEMVTGG